MEESGSEKPANAVPPPLDGQLPGSDVLRGALASDEVEIRQQIADGAGTPEELRALAERLREHRESEALLWASEVKPALVKARRTRFRRSTLQDELEQDTNSERSLALIVVVLVLVVVGMFSTLHLSILFLLVPLLGFIGYAGWLGSRPPVPPGPEGKDGPTA
ncbi:MAG: hypothetical protein EXQ71_02600 [Acidimicrobiia bacterium]|nr:hypothetical protein [Acidimicrobiia bacterium]